MGLRDSIHEPSRKWIGLLTAILIAGCGAVYSGYSSQGGGTESSAGEQHEVALPAQDTFIQVQGVLREKGVLFEVRPDSTVLTTYWKDATDAKVGFFSGAVGVQPHYRYEIQVVPESSAKSNVIVNLQTEDIPEDQVGQYKATTKYNFFNALDKLVAQAPPPSTSPAAGGVNFAMLPKEDLKAFAKRVTGDEANWQAIAKDNAISSPTDVSPFQTVWVRSSLLKDQAK